VFSEYKNYTNKARRLSKSNINVKITIITGRSSKNTKHTNPAVRLSFVNKQTQNTRKKSQIRQKFRAQK